MESSRQHIHAHAMSRYNMQDSMGVHFATRAVIRESLESIPMEGHPGAAGILWSIASFVEGKFSLTALFEHEA